MLTDEHSLIRLNDKHKLLASMDLNSTRNKSGVTGQAFPTLKERAVLGRPKLREEADVNTFELVEAEDNATFLPMLKNLRSLLPGSKQDFSKMLEDHAVANDTLPRVLYSIETGAHQSDRLKACLSTWAANLASNSLQIVGHTKLPVHELESAGARFIPTPQCPDNHNGGECKDAIALAEAYETGAEWVILVGDDNYALTRNIDEALRVFNAQEPHVIGIRGCGDCPAGGLCGGGGQIFSRGALALMLSAGRVSYLAEMGKEGSSHGYFGDVSSCRVAFSHNISIESVYGLNGWRMNKAEMESRIGSRSLKELTFHYLDPYDMYDVHSMVTRALQRPSMYEEETAQSLESGVATYMRELKLYVAAENERRHHAPGKSRKTGKMPCGWTTGP
eukprot:gnl/TRDRNA2_/TRDRNA2_175615_c0_seq6.p1 gnl/TRDRNA2_/TRDRNA2_175615_c0~~gnl/TRDRNA2_/TRDRNA2_175615_c0_seq6.p1  ORF type:complete len:391 (-),score=49.89 gnl/TRDRNA2_/TRDRNA2_175615_c0_seq6:105-1277(-)